MSLNLQDLRRPSALMDMDDDVTVLESASTSREDGRPARRVHVTGGSLRGRGNLEFDNDS